MENLSPELEGQTAAVLVQTLGGKAETLDLWLDTYQIGKDYLRRGIVEVIGL